MKPQSRFLTAFWAGLSAPLMVFAPTTSYNVYPGVSAVTQHVIAVGAALRRLTPESPHARDADPAIARR